ncbi:MAG: dihydrolipoyl dehydrogenase [Methanobacteriota archaeon]
MREFDAIAIGSGSAMNIVQGLLERDPKARVAVIDKDEPGGICLTRGCIPSKLLLYPAELVRTIEKARAFGIDVEVKRIDFARVMGRMRQVIGEDIEAIREGLSSSPNIAYYHAPAEFVAPHTISVAGDTIRAPLILLCTGSRVTVPPIEGLREAGFHTSDTILSIDDLPPTLAVIGGGYIAAEYGHFFSAMGSRVTVVGRNPRFLPDEEPEVSEVVAASFRDRMTLLTGHEVRRVERLPDDRRRILAVDPQSGRETSVDAHEILVAVGREPVTDVLRPEKGGIKVSERGWILVDDRLETSQKGVWAMGDALGRHLFKHVANYESLVVYENAILGGDRRPDYHAVPHAVFTEPEVGAVGMTQAEAVRTIGEDRVLVGFYRYADTAKGTAIMEKQGFAKVLVEKGTGRILGAHIVGPQASVLVQEVVNLMYTKEQTPDAIYQGMHIHPALSEVVQRAFGDLARLREYRTRHRA